MTKRAASRLEAALLRECAEDYLMWKSYDAPKEKIG
jgi:hypothetical protein